MSPPRDPRMSHPGHDPSEPPKRVLGVPVPSRQSVTETPEAAPPAQPASVGSAWTPGNVAAAILLILGSGGAGYLSRPASATSNEVAELQAKLKSATDALSQSEITELGKKVDAMSARLDAWQKERDRDSAHDVRQDENLAVIAEFAARLNGGIPADGFPEPSDRYWFSPNKPPPIHRTDRRWKSEP